MNNLERCFILIMLIGYIVVGLGTLLRMEIGVPLRDKLKIFILMPVIAVIGLFLWIVLCMKDTTQINEKLRDLGRYFIILPEFCEKVAIGMFLQRVRGLGNLKNNCSEYYKVTVTQAA